MSASALDSHKPAAPNAQRLLWAGFMAILASGVGFALRGGILTQGQWASEYGFTQTELGQITGGGLTGFGIVILLGALIADRVGYGRLMGMAFLMHLLSLVLTLATGYAYEAGGKPWAYQCLFWGTFLFAIGNGIAEAVVNPLVATLFPNEKTHYLNILHAGWPGGLIVGGLASFFMAGGANSPGVAWQIQVSMILVPVFAYGLMMLGQYFPRSEASQSGVPYRDMLGELGLAGALVVCALLSLFFAQDLGFGLLGGLAAGVVLWLAFGASTGFRFGYVVLAFLLLIHAMVGYVELGTDSWISKITGSIMASESYGLMLLVYTSALMFTLRFFAGPIVEKISPLGLLMASALIAAIGLTMLGFAQGALICVLAATVYAVGKTFFWPTMLAVVSEQFPRGGAITIGAAGGVGMLSAGLLGGPGLGFKQDYYASNHLKETNPAVYERYKAAEPNTFLAFQTVGLDGKKVGVLDDDGKKLMADLERTRANPQGTMPEALATEQALATWWEGAKATAAADKPLVTAATLHGSRMALKLTAIVPLVMFFCYTILFFYYKARGGYRARHVKSEAEADFRGMPTEVVEA